MRNGHRQLIAIRRLTAYVDAPKLELTHAPDAGRQIAHDGIYLVRGQGLKGGADVGQRDQVQIRVMGAQEFVRCIVIDDGNFKAVKLLQVVRVYAAFMGKNNNREIQVRAGKR